MSQWSNKFDNHQVQQLIAISQTLLDQAAEFDNDDAQALESLERLRSIHARLKRTLANVDPDLVPHQPLTNMVPHLTSMNNELQSYGSNKNSGHLINANNYADNILLQMAAIPILVTPDDVDGMRDAITSFRRSAGQLIHHLREEAESHRTVMEKDQVTSSKNIRDTTERIAEVEAELEKLDAAIQKQKARLDTAIAEFQSQFSKQQDARQVQFTEAEKERADTIKKAIAEQEVQFAAISEAHKDKFAGICDSAKEKLDAFQTATQDHADGFIEILEGHKAKAERLVHVIGNTGMVGGYQITANTARTTARIWQGIAIVSFSGMIWFAIKVFSATQSQDFSWSIFSGRVFVASTFGLAAAYAARQSDRHEETERYNRKVELELASIDPYIVGLPEPTQFQVKEELAKRLFGQKPVLKKQADVSGTNMDLLRMAIETINEMSKKH